MFNFVKVTPSERTFYNSKLNNFEKIFSYPFGDDFFTIDHGNNYFAFFDELGEVEFFLITYHQDIIASTAIVLREVPLFKHGPHEKVWYFCDLKIHPQYRGRFLLQKLIQFANQGQKNISNKLYAISMDPNPLGENRLVTLTRKLSTITLDKATHLAFYLLTYDQILTINHLLDNYFGKYRFRSLACKKDLILKSSSKPLAFLHLIPEASLNNNQNFHENPMQDFQHMFSIPINEPLTSKLKELNINYLTTATILHHNIPNSDWSFIKTSDI